jgi:hypothetical protein
MDKMQRTLAVLGICLVVFSLMTLPVDDPETSYNESETPINSAALVDGNFVADANPLTQVKHPTSLVRRERTAWHESSTNSAEIMQAHSGDSSSCLTLLCTLIC